MSPFKRAWFKAFWLGILAATVLYFFIPNTFYFLTLLLNFIVAIASNFGRGYWSQAGWSHTLQQPWPIWPIKRPRIGGFTTGYAIVALVLFYGSFLFTGGQGWR